MGVKGSQLVAWRYLASGVIQEPDPVVRNGMAKLFEVSMFLGKRKNSITRTAETSD